MKMAIALLLLLRFLAEVVRSGATTAWLIVRPGARPRSGLLRMRYDGLSDAGVALLGCMITLTPGTTTIDIDNQRGELLIHLLDAGGAAITTERIRRNFEPRLRRLFPGDPRPAPAGAA